jgi:hypothetical protein
VGAGGSAGGGGSAGAGSVTGGSVAPGGGGELEGGAGCEGSLGFVGVPPEGGEVAPPSAPGAAGASPLGASRWGRSDRVGASAVIGDETRRRAFGAALVRARLSERPFRATDGATVARATVGVETAGAGL